MSFLLIITLLLPIWFVGFKLIRIISAEKRIEVILPVSLFCCVNLFILTLNLTSYFVHPPLGIYIAYSGFILMGIVLWKYKNFILGKIDIPGYKTRKLLYLSLIVWAIFLFVIIGKMSLSGDPQFYSGIAKSFTRGNFPMVAPWQPDVKLAYHYGPAIFMGVFHIFTGSSFDLIQRSTSYVIVLMFATFLIWIFKRHITLKSLLAYQFILSIILISSGFWMIAIPTFPLEFPQNFKGILDWVAQMPAANISFSVYGGSVTTLTDMVFFYHEMIAFTSFTWILWLAFTYDRSRRILAWTILTLGLTSLSIINEIFIFLSLPAIVLVILCREFPFESFVSKKNILAAIILVIMSSVIVIFQGGVPTELLTGEKPEYPTVQFFPDKKNIFVHNAVYDNYNNLVSVENANLNTYYLQQQGSRLFLPNKEKWLPFIWYHPGIIFFYIVNIIIFLFLLIVLKDRKRILIYLIIFIPALFGTLLYNFSFSLSNNFSRVLGFSYTLLGVNLVFFLIWILEYGYKKGKFLSASIIFVVLWLTIPSVFPTLARMFTTGEKYNKLITSDQSTVNETERWIIDNLPYNARLLFLSNYSPNPRTNTGIFIPAWPGKIKSFSLDPSPQYYDLIYSLNPAAIKEFRMSHILIDSQSYSKLPEIRKEQLNSNGYFTLLYESGQEKLYQINNKYLNEISNLPGTFNEISTVIIPGNAKVYIDTAYEGLEKRGQWEGLVRAITFTLRDRTMFFKDALPGYNNQFYTSQDVKISGSEPARSIDYDYLILSYANNPNNVCDCKAEIIWKGFDDLLYIWRVLK